jgi:GntR family transcriptional regulator / MocR family aminotransferase
MPRPSSASELLVVLDRAAGPLHRQLVERLRHAVRTGVLKPGSTLPSSRMLAAQLGVSRGVVVEAYAQLVAEGYLTARPRVAPQVAVGAEVLPAAPAPAPPRWPDRPRFDLHPGTPALDAFPRSAWAASIRRVLRDAGDPELGYPEPAGHPRLRQDLAGYLARVRGAMATPERLVITQGATQGIGLACAALRARGVERIAVEDPSHRDEREVVARAGLTIVPVPVDEQGICVAALARSDARAVLVTPAHQFPTGVLLSPERRAELLDWLGDGDRYVVEDDYDAELRYGGSPVGAIQGLRPDRVLHAGSVSKSLSPGLRLGWLLLPAELVADVTERKRLTDLGSPTLDQLAFVDFLGRGEFDRHLRRLRARYRRQRTSVVAALAEHFPGCTVLGIPAGLHLAVELAGWPDEAGLRGRAREASVDVGGIGEHCIAARRPTTLLIGFARHGEATLREAVRRLATAAGAAP